MIEEITQSQLFSVLVANYNNSAFIKETIDSVKKQSYINWEIIIVDDASTDNSLEIINDLCRQDIRIHLFKNKENKGCGYTKNRCVKEAKGSICAFLDPEDTIVIGAIETMVNEHIKYPKASLIFSSLYHCNEKLEVQYIQKPTLAEGILHTSHLIDHTICHFASFKRDLYFNTKQIDKSLKRAVDQDLYLKLEEKGDVYFIDQPLYYYRYHNKGISAYKNKYKADFWNYYVRYHTCLRRGIEPETYFAKVIEDWGKTYKHTVHYKLGYYLLTPYRFIKKIFKH